MAMAMATGTRLAQRPRDGMMAIKRLREHLQHDSGRDEPRPGRHVLGSLVSAPATTPK